MDIKNIGFASIEQIQNQYLQKKTVQSDKTDGTVSFEDLLKEKAEQKKTDGELKFSKHAAKRLLDRNIDLTNGQIERLNKGVRLCSEKGIKESLVLMDEYAFIVNTQNNTVVTALEHNNEGENIYTNIDGAVMV